MPTILLATTERRLWCYEERDCCRFVALNIDLLHGEWSPPVEARPPLSFAPGQGKEGVAYSLAWLD